MRWHLITGEYPPQPGGVSDYTQQLAQGLADVGDEVHVWTAGDFPSTTQVDGVIVHRLSSGFGVHGLRQLDRGLRDFPATDRVVVQYVPHMYGYKAMNLGFALWLRLRARRYWIMFHEVAFPIEYRQKLRHNLLGGVTRVMAHWVAQGAEEIFVSVPYWETVLRKQCFVRRPVCWLPAPSNLPTEVDAQAAARTRSQLFPEADTIAIGHFSTYQEGIAANLRQVLPPLLRRDRRRRAVLLGRGSVAFADAMMAANVDLADRVIARADLPAREAAEHLAACDLLLQPYSDGVSSRRTSVMAGLALGRAIVTTEGIVTEPIWRSAALVELLPAADCAGMVERSEMLLGAPEVRERLGDRARQGYRSLFCCERMIATLRASL